MYIEVKQTISNIIEKRISQTVIEVKPFDTGVGKIAESVLQVAGDMLVKYKSGQVGRLPAGANGLFLHRNTALEEGFDYAQLIGLAAMTLTNKDTVAANQGDVVVIDTANASAFLKSTVQGQANLIGVVYDTSILVNAIGTIQYGGTALVNVAGNVAIGDYLIGSSTKGLAKSNGNVFSNNAFAMALTAYTGGASGQVYARLDTQIGDLNWQDFNPSFGNFVPNLSSVTARFCKIGKTIPWRVDIVLNTATMYNGIDILLPFAPAGPINGHIGEGRLVDATPAAVYQATVYLISSTRARIQYLNIDAKPTGITDTLPFTWANNDEIHLSGIYEAA
ncbi:MAG: hypothetical protein ABFD24_06175 [Anaerolineaceae bacterium]